MLRSLSANGKPSCVGQWALAWTVLLLLAGSASVAAPLSERIDQAIAAGLPNYSQLAAPHSSDAEFVRRIYLDLTGTIPTAAEARAFLSERAANKREKLIDRLLASPEYARHLATVFDVLLMERRPDKLVPRGQWQDFLRTSFAQNKPWDQLVREMLSADGSDPKLRPAAKFSLDRDADPNLLTRDISRLFLGMNFQCCQCHDHPLVEDYKQDLYYGVFAFLNRSYLFADKAKNLTVLAEKAEGEATYQSVFDPKKLTKTAGPRVPGGQPVKEPKFDKGKEYETIAAKAARPIPKFSRRAQLAAQVVNPGATQFKRNIVNRLWALMMGRGLVHPVDYQHSANPPSHPELLALLADEFASHKFDIKWLLREMALSKTYQRSSEQPPGAKEVPADRFAVARLKPLSPEPLAWAVMQATGLTDAERRSLGQNANEATLHSRLAGNVGPFVNTFGNRPGQPQSQSFEATLEQTLFLTNGPVIRGWLSPRSGNLTDRLMQWKEPGAVAEELFVSVLTRPPTEDERKEVAEYLKTRAKDRSAGLQDLAWALLASAEFRFNH